jgi:hypothetical protein
VSDWVYEISPFEFIPSHGQSMSRRAFERFRERVKMDGKIRIPVKFVEIGHHKYLVDGHHRVRAARELGFSTVPAIRVELPFSGYLTLEDLFEREA